MDPFILVKHAEKFAQDYGLPFYSMRKEECQLPKQRSLYHPDRYVIYDLRKFAEGVIFIFYDSKSFYGGSGNMYCGVFKEIPNLVHNVTIRKRDFLDILSFKRRYLTGIKPIDRKLTIRAETDRIDDAILRTERMEEFIEMIKTLGIFITLETEKQAMSVYPELFEKNLISITTTGWLQDYDCLEGFIMKGCELMDKM